MPDLSGLLDEAATGARDLQTALLDSIRQVQWAVEDLTNTDLPEGMTALEFAARTVLPSRLVTLSAQAQKIHETLLNIKSTVLPIPKEPTPHVTS